MAITFDNCYAEAATDKALLVHIPEVDTKPQWIPQKHITEDSEVWKKGDEGKLIITDWIAEKKGWV